jgi:hypothetical protein
LPVVGVRATRGSWLGGNGSRAFKVSVATLLPTGSLDGVSAYGVCRMLNADRAGAAERAAWKKRVRTGRAGVRVEHVESSGVGDAAEVGALPERPEVRLRG